MPKTNTFVLNILNIKFGKTIIKKIIPNIKNIYFIFITPLPIFKTPFYYDTPCIGNACDKPTTLFKVSHVSENVNP